jgi:hypothetical protein
MTALDERAGQLIAEFQIAVLIILIPVAAWLAILLFTLTMCRLAARSDSSYAVGSSEPTATGHPVKRETAPPDTPAE